MQFEASDLLRWRLECNLTVALLLRLLMIVTELSIGAWELYWSWIVYHIK